VRRAEECLRHKRTVIWACISQASQEGSGAGQCHSTFGEGRTPDIHQWASSWRSSVVTFTPGQTACPQLTACFTSATIFASSAAVNSFSAKATGHAVPSSRCALSLKPSVAYRALNFSAAWKKQMILPSLLA
jgi:hypothetical protein